MIYFMSISSAVVERLLRQGLWGRAFCLTRGVWVISGRDLVPGKPVNPYANTEDGAGSVNSRTECIRLLPE